MSDFQNIDVAVIRDFSRGCEYAYGLICELYKPLVYKFTFGYVKSDYFATKIVDEVFSIVWNNKYEYGTHSPSQFEFTILCFARHFAFKVLN